MDAPIATAEVLVVGAGFAGLSAARALSRQGFPCLVLEARDRVGGRSLSQPLGHDTIDLGGQWIGPGQERLRRLAHEFGVRTFPQFHQGTKLLSWNGRLQRYHGELPNLSWLAQWELWRADRRLRRFAEQIPPGAPWQAPFAAWADGQTLETWMRSAFRSAGARLFFDIVTRAVLTSEPRDVSLLFFLSYLRWGQGLERLISIEGGAQQERFIGGVQPLAQCLADELGANVYLNTPVRALEQHAHGILAHTPQGTFAARRAIVALPPALAGRLEYTPGLPPQRDQLTARMPMGSVIKYIAAYERPFWREAGLSGEAFCDRGITTTTFDDSSHDGRQAALVTFSDGDAARQAAERSPPERRAAVLAEFVRFFGPQAVHPSQFVEKNWNDDPWSRGCYVGVMGPGTMTGFGPALRAPCGRIHWAGTETAREWMGYFEGALESAERVVAELLPRLAAERSSHGRNLA